jgi:hypothetical protein
MHIATVAEPAAATASPSKDDRAHWVEESWLDGAHAGALAVRTTDDRCALLLAESVQRSLLELDAPRLVREGDEITCTMATAHGMPVGLSLDGNRLVW